MLNEYLLTSSNYLEHCENLYLIILVISFSRANRILFTTTHLSLATKQCFTKKKKHFFQISIQKDELCTIKDNSNKMKWKVSTSRGGQGEAPGVMFLLTPPDQEAIETAEKLKRHYDRVITLWQKKHLRMRQNMIFATIKVVKSWDFQQYMSMEKEQRIAIRRALNEDSDKLIQEGEPNDPQLKRLQREIEEVNRLFDEWERRAALEEERRNAAKAFNDR